MSNETLIPYCHSCGTLGDGSCCNAGANVTFLTVEEAVREVFPLLRKRITNHWDAVFAAQWKPDPEDDLGELWVELGAGLGTERRILRSVLAPYGGLGKAGLASARKAYIALLAEAREKELADSRHSFCG